MKKLILLIGFVLMSVVAQGATATNKIVNTLTMTSSNSPVEVGFFLTAGSTMAQTASPQAFTHSLINYNPNNPTCVIWNTAISGSPRFKFKDWTGVDSSEMGDVTVGRNLVLHT